MNKTISARNRWATIFSLVACLMPALVACDQMPDWTKGALGALKPDIHVVLKIKPDYSNTVQVEVAFHPVIDSVVKSYLEYLKQNLEQQKKITMTTPRVFSTVREGRNYNALAIDLRNLEDLNSLANTPSFFGVNLLFSDFQVWCESATFSQRMYFSATLPAQVTQLVVWANVTVHVILPYSIQSSNGRQVGSNEVTWVVQPGQPLEMRATAGGFTFPGLGWLLVSGGTIVLVLVAAAATVAVGVWWWRSRRFDPKRYR